MAGSIEFDLQSGIPPAAPAGYVRLYATAAGIQCIDSTGAPVPFGDVGVTATTTNATPAVLTSVVVAADSALWIRALVVGRLAGGSALAGRQLAALVRRPTSGNITLIAEQNDALVEDSAGAPNITASVDTATQTYRISVTGVASETWNWIARLEVVRA